MMELKQVILLSLVLGGVFGLVPLTHAQTAVLDRLEWVRNTEADMASYNVYVCPIAACIVQKIPAQLVQSIVQPAVGSVPKTTTVLGVGAAAVSAVDTTGNESPLSNQVSRVRDSIPPAAPLGLNAF